MQGICSSFSRSCAALATPACNENPVAFATELLSSAATAGTVCKMTRFAGLVGGRMAKDRKSPLRSASDLSSMNTNPRPSSRATLRMPQHASILGAIVSDDSTPYLGVLG